MGRFSYNGRVGHWWLRHSTDPAHRRAYRKIADFIRDSFICDPTNIVDYACGPGNLLSLLSERFCSSKLTGLDGSSLMLQEARRLMSRLPEQCSGRISLIETPLPNMNVSRGEADLVIYCFPNMVPFSNEHDYFEYLSDEDRLVAGILSRMPDDCETDSGTPGPLANQVVLEQGRCISLNLRRLLVPEGICVRVEYATVRREDLSPRELACVSFEEGSLDFPVEGRTSCQWFRVVASAFFRSKVLEDVYEQTGDERDKSGGYLVTILRAI